MPFETITHRINVHTPTPYESPDGSTGGTEIDVRQYHGDVLRPGQTLHEENSLVLHWSADRSEHGGSAQACIRMSRDQLVAYVESLKNMPEGWGGPVEIWVDFHDRHELNNLVRTARRVRDQVFGKDE